MTDAFLAPSLDHLRDEIDRKYPGRDRASDGWIGDAKHSSRDSQHNPHWDAPGKWSGVVQAIDLDNNGKPGQLTPLVRDVLEATIGDHRVWYVIWNGGIWSRTNAWARKPYRGANPHDKHVHVSIRESIPSWSDRSSWLKEAPAVKPPTYKAMPKCDAAFWNMNNGDRPGVRQALDAIAASGCRLIGLNECGGHWKTIRRWATDRGFTIVTGTGDIGASSAALVRHRTGHQSGGVKTIRAEWEGPQGKEIAGRPIVYEKAVYEDRRIMTLVFHQVWGPNREDNEDAKRALVEQQREWIMGNPGWDVYVAPDWNEARSSREPFSPLGTANLTDGRILKGGDGPDYVLYVPAKKPTMAMATDPSTPRVVVGPDYDSDHNAIGVNY